tara:strand:+ start:763 stop:1122 length:360 start_codon:yes stop_codon:yes gene_type:complete
MKLYTNNKGDWAGTQSDARKQFKKDRTTVEVPTDKPNLMAFLNRNKVGSNLQAPPNGNKTPPSGNDGAIPISSSNGDENLNTIATSWVAWALDTLNRGDINESKAMLTKGLQAQYDRSK